MKLFAGIFILVIVFFVAWYVLRTVGKKAVLDKRRRMVQDYFLNQVGNFPVDSSMVFNQQNDLYSQSRMINAGIEVNEEEIQLVDYTKDVPWFFYL